MSFDANASVKRLVDAGMPEPQAKAIVDQLVTRADMRLMGVDLRGELALVRNEIAAMAAMETRLRRWAFALLIAQTVLLAALILLN